MGRPVPDELDELLSAFPAPVAATALAIRHRVLSVVPRAHEIVWDATNALSIVHGASSRWRDDALTHIAVYSRHVNLGFNEGAALPDPESVLVGSGARIRHVSFGSEQDVVGATWIEGYVRAAAAAAGLPVSMGDGATTVRRSSGPKRRPR